MLNATSIERGGLSWLGDELELNSSPSYNEVHHVWEGFQEMWDTKE